jgi:hypothetical protein
MFPLLREKPQWRRRERDKGEKQVRGRWSHQMSVDTERGVNQYQVQFKTFFNLYLNHSIISNEQ